MAGKIDTRLAELGIALDASPPPVANYVPCVRTGSLVFVSGQIARSARGLEFPGQVGTDITIDQATQAARFCAINVIAALKAELGGDLGDELRALHRPPGKIEAHGRSSRQSVWRVITRTLRPASSLWTPSTTIWSASMASSRSASVSRTSSGTNV